MQAESLQTLKRIRWMIVIQSLTPLLPGYNKEATTFYQVFKESGYLVWCVFICTNLSYFNFKLKRVNL